MKSDVHNSSLPGEDSDKNGGTGRSPEIMPSRRVPRFERPSGERLKEVFGASSGAVLSAAFPNIGIGLPTLSHGQAVGRCFPMRERAGCRCGACERWICVEQLRRALRPRVATTPFGALPRAFISSAIRVTNETRFVGYSPRRRTHSSASPTDGLRSPTCRRTSARSCPRQRRPSKTRPSRFFARRNAPRETPRPPKPPKTALPRRHGSGKAPTDAARFASVERQGGVA
jgi:hypothetical protein